MTTDKPARPANLGDGGGALWDSIAPYYELRPDEWRILLDACREADLVDRLQEEMLSASLVTRGSMGQEVSSPYVSEIRQHRAVTKMLLAALKIPDSPAGASRKRAVVSEQARAAARSRWGSGAGA